MVIQRAIMYLAIAGFALTAIAFLLGSCTRVVVEEVDRLRGKIGAFGLFAIFALAAITTIEAQKADTSRNLARGRPLLDSLTPPGDGQLDLDDSGGATNLAFTGIWLGQDSVRFALSWPLGQRHAYYDLFGSTDLVESVWTKVSSMYPIGEQEVTNHVGELFLPWIFPGDIPTRLFLRAVWHVDSDNDDLNDGDELYVYWTDPDCADTDGDGLIDSDEIIFGTLPTNPDTDGDGFPDGWDLEYFDPFTDDSEQAEEDGDLDGLTNREEAEQWTDPSCSDTDGDWLEDGWEVYYGLDPLDATGDNGRFGDPDLDGLVNAAECDLGTDPLDPDSDHDGLMDGCDGSPLIHDGDCFGPGQELPSGADTNAYCWIDLFAPDSDAAVRFVGDAPSNLQDPCFMLRAGATNRVMLLIGKTYKIFCRQQVGIVGRSDERIEIDEAADAISVCWPVSISMTTFDDNAYPGLSVREPILSTSFTMNVSPACLGGHFIWTNVCCRVSGSNGSYVLTCDSGCACLGCTAAGYYTYEGYLLPASGASCGCTPENYDPAGGDIAWGPYPPGVSVSFSENAVIYEDAYTNRPGEVVDRRSTRTVLECRARGGAQGDTVSFSGSGVSKLLAVDGNVSCLPTGLVRVPAGSEITYSIEYEGILPSSSRNDIVVTGRFVEDKSGDVFNADDRLTSVKLQLTAVYDAPENPNPSRHVYGVGEKVRFKTVPLWPNVEFYVDKTDVEDNVTSYDTFEGEAVVDAGAVRTYKCPIVGTTPNIRVCCHGVQYVPLMTVIEPQVVLTPEATGSGAFLPGHVGMGCLTTHNYIGPMTVSFQGIHVYEVPCEDPIPPTGYFATNYVGHLVHNYDAGAGSLHLIGTNNYWMTDNAGRDEPYPNWSAGRLVWKIPIGWRRIRNGGEGATLALSYDYECYDDPCSRPLVIGNSEDTYLQVYSIESNGTSAVEKFGYRLSRGRWEIWGAVTPL